VPIHEAYICTELEQLKNSIGVTALRSLYERTLPSIIGAVNMSSLSHKPLDLIDLSPFRCPYQVSID
jgi:hypothetical protein